MRNKFAAIALTLALPLSAMADSDDPRVEVIEARQSIMHLYSFSMGTLGAMAKGRMEYDAEKAARAAKNLSLASQIDQSEMWVPGTDNSVEDLKDVTEAKPDGWANYEKVSKINGDFKMAALKLEAEAGKGLGALRGSIGGVGKGCKGCHDITKAK